jgi:NADH:ubiquinone oxidoreductase subunit 2 (subunit N)
VVVVMWAAPADDAPAERRLRVPVSVATVGTIGAVAVIALAIWAQPLLDLCRGAARALMLT